MFTQPLMEPQGVSTCSTTSDGISPTTIAKHDLLSGGKGYNRDTWLINPPCLQTQSPTTILYHSCTCIPLYSHSTHMLHLSTLDHPPAQIPSHTSIEQLHHHPKQPSRERSVPSSLGRSVPDERVLRLDLVELWSIGSARRRVVAERMEDSRRR
jgi:hypothetical protein